MTGRGGMSRKRAGCVLRDKEGSCVVESSYIHTVVLKAIMKVIPHSRHETENETQ